MSSKRDSSFSRRHRSRHDPDGKSKKRRKSKSRSVREIEYYRSTTMLLLRKIPFYRIVREVVADLFPNSSYRFQETSLQALQEACESYLVNLFEMSGKVAGNSNRMTLMVRDMQLVSYVRVNSDYQF